MKILEYRAGQDYLFFMLFSIIAFVVGLGDDAVDLTGFGLRSVRASSLIRPVTT
jgi:hypothetical protein